MVYLPVQFLKPGMVLAHDVISDTSCLSFVVHGQVLTEEHINKLIYHDIPGAYIETKFAQEVQPEPLIPPEVKRKTINELKNMFGSYTKKTTITAATYQDIRRTAEKLLLYAVSKEECMLNIIEIKDYDDYTYSHSMYVGILSALIGIQLKLSRQQQLDLCTCGLLHDTGKLDIPIEIINKPSQLSEDEFELMKTHPDRAVERLRSSGVYTAAVIAGIRTHHEWMDGTGYPLGLKGDDIPMYGRILALADVYDALTSRRSYRKAWSSSEAIEYMMGGAQTHFDHDVLQAFLKTVAAYPVGTIVKLSNGDTAIVIKNYPNNILRPKVKVFTGVSELGKEIDLSNDFTYLNVIVEGTIKPEDKLSTDFV